MGNVIRACRCRGIVLVAAPYERRIFGGLVLRQGRPASRQAGCDCRYNDWRPYPAKSYLAARPAFSNSAPGQSRISTKWPSIAAAATIIGLAR